MKTARPTAERLLAQFDSLHLLINEHRRVWTGQEKDIEEEIMVEELTSLQKTILSLFKTILSLQKIPESIYTPVFQQRLIKQSIIGIA